MPGSCTGGGNEPFHFSVGALLVRRAANRASHPSNRRGNVPSSISWTRSLGDNKATGGGRCGLSRCGRRRRGLQRCRLKRRGIDGRDVRRRGMECWSMIRRDGQ